jgi:tRNA (mo5U34)-methyltransferase
MARYTAAEIRARIKQFKTWYHNIELNGVSTNPANPSYPETRWRTIEPYVPPDLTGETVLDLGCNAGYFSLKMQERGGRVLGVDWYTEAIEQARFVADALNAPIEYRVQNIYDFVLTNEDTFDYVIFLGVFYHLRYPLLVLDQLARITRKKLYFQSVVKDTGSGRDVTVPDDIRADDYDLLNDPDFPKMCFIEHKLEGGYNNWFVCNSSGVAAMLRSAGFKNLVKAGGDCFICDPPDRRARVRISHDLRGIRRQEDPLTL